MSWVKSESTYLRMCLVQQSCVQSILVSAVVRGNDDPVDSDAFGNGVVLLKEALELFVPCVDVENLSFGFIGESGGDAQREHHDQNQKHCDGLFHDLFLLINIVIYFLRVFPADHLV